MKDKHLCTFVMETTNFLSLLLFEDIFTFLLLKNTPAFCFILCVLLPLLLSVSQTQGTFGVLHGCQLR